MNKKLKKGLIKSGLIGFGVGCLYLILSFTIGSFITQESGLLFYLGLVLMFTIGLPALLTGWLFDILGYTTMGYFIQFTIFALIIYFLLGNLLYVLHSQIRKK
jgi:hypothetical protein